MNVIDNQTLSLISPPYGETKNNYIERSSLTTLNGLFSRGCAMEIRLFATLHPLFLIWNEHRSIHKPKQCMYLTQST